MRTAIIETNAGCRLQIYAAPRASKSQVVGEHDGRIKILVAAPPVDGEANAALIKYLSNVLGVPKASVVIVAGQTGKRKTLDVRGIDAETAFSRLNGQL